MKRISWIWCFALVAVLALVGLLPACGGDDDDDEGDDDLDDDDDNDTDDDDDDTDDDDDDTDDDCPDADGDSFDDAACGGQDCDDANPDVNPDAAEVCGDEVDNDCDGTPEDGCLVWQNETVDTIGLEEGFAQFSMPGTALVFLDGAPMIAYYAHEETELRVARKDGKAWTVEVVDSDGKTGNTPSMALDPTGGVGILYYNRGRIGTIGRGAYYASGGTGSWTIEQVTGGLSGGGQYTVLQFDSTGTAHAVMTNGSGDAVQYARRSGSAWTFEEVEHPEGYVDKFDMALDADNYPFVTMQAEVPIDEENSVTANSVAFKDASGWQIGYISTEIDRSDSSSVVFDKVGNPVIAMTDDLREDLLVMWWQGYWNEMIVESEFSVGEYVCLALDPEQNVTASYYNRTLGTLKFARFTTEWEIETVDDSPNVGRYTSLAYNDEGYPAISYVDAANKTLKFAQQVLIPEVE